MQKIFSRNYKDKKYYKYILVIPKKHVEKSEFKEGDNLEVFSKKGKIEVKNEKKYF